jgi:uncharacterized membrane protein
MTRTAVLVAATVLNGLSAGLFTTFSYAVMPGLRRTDDTAFVQSMRAINVAILNPVFAVIFGGAFVVTAVALISGWHGPSRTWVVVGLLLYIGVLVVTFAVNVPLNEALNTGTDRPATLRAAFESRWVLWNHVRSMLSTAAFISLVVGLLKI